MTSRLGAFLVASVVDERARRCRRMTVREIEAAIAGAK